MDLLSIAEHNSKKRRPVFYGILGMLSVIRGYNILVIIIAQYLASIFVFRPEKHLQDILLDGHLFLTVLATSCVIAAGYIINNFYDSEVDKINKPLKSKIDSFVSQNTKLYTYFSLNALGFFLGFLVSWKAALFFSVYIFLIWLYSHKLKRYPIPGLLFASLLGLLPFFVIFVYHKNISEVIVTHAAFLFCILLIRELLKDLENLKGLFVFNYQTVTVKYGEHFTKILISIIILMSFNPIYFLWKYPEIGLMKYYFYFVFIVLIGFVFLLWKAQTKLQYSLLHNVVKILLVLGVFSLALIDTTVIIGRILNRL